MIIKNKSKGFTLIELILVLGLTSTAFLALMQWQKKNNETYKAKIAGEQFSEVGRALGAYIAREQEALYTIIGEDSVIDLPLDVLKGTNFDMITPGPAAGAPCFPEDEKVLCGRTYLPTTFKVTHALGNGFLLQVRRKGGEISGLVISSEPICEKGNTVPCGTQDNPIRMDWAGLAVREIGSQGGLVNLGNSEELSGYNASWILTKDDFSSISKEGQIGYRVSTTDYSLYDSQYLRLDGTSVMRGNLNMGNWDINNATNITYNGWLSGNGILANMITSGTINNRGNIQTTNLYATYQIKAGTENVPDVTKIAPVISGTGPTVGVGKIESDNSITANNVVTAFRAVSTRDIFLGDNDAAIGDLSTQENQRSGGRKIPNLWLSDLIPKYVSHGAKIVRSGETVVKPLCGGNGAGKARIILTPQRIALTGSVVPESVSTNVNANSTSNSSSSSSANWYENSTSKMVNYINVYTNTSTNTNTNITMDIDMKLNAAVAGRWDATDSGTQWSVKYEAPTKSGITLSPDDNVALAQIYCSYNLDS